MSNPTEVLSNAIRRPRLLSAIAVAVLAFGILQFYLSNLRSLLIAFDTAVLLYLILMLILFTEATPQTMRRRAQIQEDGKWTVLIVSVIVAFMVIGALSSDLHAAKEKSFADIALASGTILMSWLFVAFTFSQQYAHTFYTQADQLQFPGTTAPDYWDFLYFSTVLSMCCQTSDVAVCSSSLRRIVLLQSVLSFFFNVIIISITVNVVAGVL
jgi:uncharacterized membrane protein